MLGMPPAAASGPAPHTAAPSVHPTSSPSPLTHPPQFLDFLLFLWVASRFRYRTLPHATVGVEALALTPDKSGLGLTLAMSKSEPPSHSRGLAEGGAR